MADATRSSSEHENEPRHRRVAPVLIMAVTLVGGVLALVDARVSDHASAYGDAAREKLVQALGEREQATASLVLEDQAETAAAMDATLATGPTGVSDVALASLLSSLGVADASSARVVSKYSRLGFGSAVLEDGTAASVLFQTQQVREFKRTREYQEADEQTSEEFASKSADVETAITILAVALFLLGLSLTVTAAKARHVLTATGVAIAAVAGTWGIAAAIHPVACVAVGTVGLVEKCARRELDKAQTNTHLEHVYERLLSVPSNHVIVIGYHTPHPALNEKLFGHAILAYAPAVTFSHVKVIIDVINTTVAEAAADVAGHGENHLRIHFVSMPAWPERDHQCLDTAHQPWVISTDFCIHPTDAGYAQFVDRLVSYLRQNPEAAGFKPGWLS